MSKEKEDKSPAPRFDDQAGGMNMGVAIIGFLLCFIAGALVMWAWDKKHGVAASINAESTESETATWSDEGSPIAVSSKDPMWGKRDAPLTMVQFSDFQCPYCKRVEDTIDQVKKQYGPDKLRIIWKENPLPMHPNARPAAEAAQGVFALKGSDAFWKFHDLAFKNQTALSEDNYVKWAKEAGVTDTAAFKAGLDSHKWADKVDKDLSVGKSAGVSGTPHMIVNGVSINGAQPMEKFTQVLDAELKKAEAKAKGGTAKDRVYVAMSQENFKAPAQGKEEEEEDDKTVWKVPVGTSPQLGNPNAMVTIIEFSDFQCPFCGKVEPTIKALRDKYQDKLRLVWKNEPLPFHNRAEPAAEVAEEALAEKGPKGFWQAHDALFEKQKDLNDDVLAGVASEVGLNADKTKGAITNHTYKKVLDSDSDVAEDFQANGTPHFFINGRRISGAQPQERFEKIIDEEVKHAQDLLAKGTKPAELYDALIKDGKEPPPPEKKTLPQDLPTNDPAKGSLNGKVTIHEFSDFQCPYCGRVEDTLKEVMKNYGDKVKFVWHDMPLPMHPDAPLAAQAAREALKQKGPQAFWSMHDKMFSNQKAIKRDDLDKDAQDLGLDMDKWKAALDGGVHKAEVDADAKSGNSVGIQGTPAFIIVPNGAGGNGYFVNGAQGFPKFRKLIERALSEAK
jgi:protein-disulfide isomerase